MEIIFFTISNFKNKSDRPLICKRDKLIVFTKENMEEKHKSIIIGTHGNHLSVSRKTTNGLASDTKRTIPPNIKTAQIFIYFR